MTTINELNQKICEALGWEERADSECPGEIRWRVPSSQPWNEYFNDRRINGNDSDCPDFIRDPAEAWRLMVWCRPFFNWVDSKQHYCCRIGDRPPRDDRPASYHPHPAIALALAFLASKGVQATPPEDA